MLQANSFNLYNLEGENNFKELLLKEKKLFKNPELKNKVKVKFNLNFSQKKLMDFDFYITGNNNFLGEWNPVNALGPMKISGNENKTASFEFNFYENSFFEYKYLKKYKNGQVEWMNCENKIGHTTTSETIINDSWN